MLVPAAVLLAPLHVQLAKPNLAADALPDPCVHRRPLPLACRLRPNMAHHFPFELDVFQKEAICHLEQARTLHMLPSQPMQRQHVSLQHCCAVSSVHFDLTSDTAAEV